MKSYAPLFCLMPLVFSLLPERLNGMHPIALLDHDLFNVTKTPIQHHKREPVPEPLPAPQPAHAHIILSENAPENLETNKLLTILQNDPNQRNIKNFTQLLKQLIEKKVPIAWTLVDAALRYEPEWVSILFKQGVITGNERRPSWKNDTLLQHFLGKRLDTYALNNKNYIKTLNLLIEHTNLRNINDQGEWRLFYQDKDPDEQIRERIVVQPTSTGLSVSYYFDIFSDPNKNLMSEFARDKIRREMPRQ